ncbi:MAG: MBL fold metallo-hydrolase [Bacteroidales bacterium]|nr:MBL fold metallo-hydrolase [Bacteroidales bacterium]
MQFKTLIFNAFQENTYLLYDGSGEAAIVDAGCATPRERERMQDVCAELCVRPTLLLNTHCHIDHLLGVAYLKHHYGAQAAAHPDDAPLLRTLPAQAGLFGVPLDEVPQFDMDLKHQQTVRFGNTTLLVLHTPGHSPGGVCFLHQESGTLLSGDTLFQGSVGRTDLPGGDYGTLMQSIKQHLLTLPNATVVLPGHGPQTTIEYERNHNPFINS